MPAVVQQIGAALLQNGQWLDALMQALMQRAQSKGGGAPGGPAGAGPTGAGGPPMPGA